MDKLDELFEKSLEKNYKKKIRPSDFIFDFLTNLIKQNIKLAHSCLFYELFAFQGWGHSKSTKCQKVNVISRFWVFSQGYKIDKMSLSRPA